MYLRSVVAPYMIRLRQVSWTKRTCEELISGSLKGSSLTGNISSLFLVAFIKAFLSRISRCSNFTEIIIAPFAEHVVLVVLVDQGGRFEVLLAQFELGEAAPAVLSAALEDLLVQVEQSLTGDAGQCYLT